MLSLSPDPSPIRLPAPFNLAAHVLSRAEALGDKIALQVLRPTGAERWSYARLERAVRGVATGLADRGLAPGDRVLLRLGNGVEFPLVFLGAMAAGFVPVVCSSQLTRPEVDRIASDLAPRIAVAAEGIARPDTIPAIPAGDIRAMETLAPAPYAMGDPDRPAYVVYTSGTSGAARAVLHAHRAILARAMMLEGWYGLRESDRVLHAGAMNWTYTLGTGLMDPWTAGATALVPAAGVTPDQIPLLLRRFDATIFAAAPGVYRQMLKSPSLPPLPRLRHGLSAGEKLPDATRAGSVLADHRGQALQPARVEGRGIAGARRTGHHHVRLGNRHEEIMCGEAGPALRRVEVEFRLHEPGHEAVRFRPARPASLVQSADHQRVDQLHGPRDHVHMAERDGIERA